MKRLLSTAFIFFGLYAIAQVNMTQVGFLDIPEVHQTKLNDIWGYVDEFGNEYALCGAEDGFSVVSLADPANPIEFSWVDGTYSIWRDIKTYEDYAYITTEATDGLLLVDLSGLPASPVTPFSFYFGPVGNEWQSAHNLYEQDGYLYIFGANRGNGGVIILDVATDPANPQEVGVFDNWYVHDGVVLNDTGYFAHINDGFFSIVDLTDKSNPVLLGTSTTPGVFTHNIWTTDDGDFAITTDEISGGYLGSYDISDPANIKYLDKIQSSPGEGKVPHNAHVVGNYVVTSYYTDGVVVHDITHPYNMVEVANFDSSPFDSPTFNGCWGAYPYLPSGLVLGSDREEGLFILDVDYHQGAYLEGNVTELGTGSPLNNVEITFDDHNIIDGSDVFGDYATGIDSSGTYDITFFKLLYYPKTISVDLTQGAIANLDVELEKIPQYFTTITVLDAQTLQPIENAQVELEHPYVSDGGVTDANGELTLGLFYEDVYSVDAGKWGYITSCYQDTLINSSVTNITLYLEEGIYDDFTFDYGWTVYGTAEKGMWEREVPVGVDIGGVLESPYFDSDWDCGSKAFLTGNGSSAGNDQEVENGDTYLVSPVFDLTGYSDPHINYNVFYYNNIGPFYPDDTLFVDLYNGTETVNLQKFHIDNTFMSHWLPFSVPVGNLMTMTSTMQLIVHISDYPETVNICDAAFDNFYVTDFSMASTDELLTDQISIFPNPVTSELNILGVLAGSVQIRDVSGKMVSEQGLNGAVDMSGLQKGIYLISILNDQGQLLKIEKVIKE
jgi:choice-of-anchor B domain-containing protein